MVAMILKQMKLRVSKRHTLMQLFDMQRIDSKADETTKLVKSYLDTAI